MTEERWKENKRMANSRWKEDERKLEGSRRRMKGRQNEGGKYCIVCRKVEGRRRGGGGGKGGNYTHRFFITVDIRQWECSLLCALSNS
jgi:hypothetical protein